MDKFKRAYNDFYEFSKPYLERSSGQKVGKKDPESDLLALLSSLPLLEEKIGALNNEMSIETVICAMQNTDFRMLSFWYMRSDAKVKSLYNKIATECEKQKFIEIFKNMLLSVKVIASINNMYCNMKKDTNEIVEDVKKILEIISLLKNVGTEQQAYKILMDNNSFITKTINKVLADSDYIIKIIALFNTDVVSDKIKLEEYKDVFSFSKENVIFGIRCFSNITVDGIEHMNNKYIHFFRKILSNIMMFQASEVKVNQFIQVFSKLSKIVYSEIKTNDTLHVLLKEVIESLKEKVSIEDLKQRKVNNLQGLIGEISSNREMYKTIFIEEYTKHRTTLILAIQCIVDSYNVKYQEGDIDVEFIFDFIQDNYILKL
ncbi:SWPV1-216 [Shearwaterpox virus]|uniref:SWPV1-216 n=1 Tax=Shearwaterpox virus TaxID=1974596 RepID=A0A1V0S844_CNPV|nr:SWPV1-216 [Shearwaterpox virus]